MPLLRGAMYAKGIQLHCAPTVDQRETWTPTMRHIALDDLVNAIREFRKFTDQPLTLRSGDYAHAVQALNGAIDRASGLLQS